MSFASVLLDGILAIWVICWPITAKKWGPTYMAQQSLLILLYLVITNQLRRFLTLFLRGKTAKSIFGLLKLVLIVNLIFQPFISILVPESVAYFYSLILLLLEPYIIWLETKLVLEYIYRSGRWVGNLVFDICEENVLVKVGVLTASTMIYICSCVLLYKGVIQVQSHFFAWFALALVIIHTLAGIASYIALDGVITNSALVFLTSAAGFYIASLATVMKRLDEASEDAPRQMVAGQVSIYQQLNYLITIAADETVTQQIFPRTPKTSGIIWIVSLIRVIAFVTWISNSLTTSRGSGGGWKSARGEEEENLDETNENFSQDLILDGGSFDGISNVQSFPSWLKVSLDILDGDVATLNKIIAIILYTQQIIQASNEPSQSPPPPTFSSSSSPDHAVDGDATLHFYSFSPFPQSGQTFTNLHFLSVVRLVQSLFIPLRFIFHVYGHNRDDYLDGCYY